MKNDVRSLQKYRELFNVHTSHAFVTTSSTEIVTCVPKMGTTA